MDGDGGVVPHGHQQNNHQRTQRRGQSDPEITPEFVLHGTALTIAGGDGSVRDKGQVVAEHGAAHHGAHAQGGGEAGHLSHLHGDGGDEGDGAHGGAHGGGHEAGHHKQHRHGEPGGNPLQHEVSHALGGAAAHHAYESAGGEENQQHGDDVLIPHTLAHDGQLFLKGNASVLQTGHKNRRQKGYDNGYVIEAHGNLHAVFKQQAQSQIQDQEDGNGQQRDRVPLFHR